MLLARSDSELTVDEDALAVPGGRLLTTVLTPYQRRAVELGRYDHAARDSTAMSRLVASMSARARQVCSDRRQDLHDLVVVWKPGAQLSANPKSFAEAGFAPVPSVERYTAVYMACAGRGSR